MQVEGLYVNSTVMTRCSGPAGTPKTQCTDFSSAQQLKGTHELSPMACAVVSGVNLAQWPQELEVALDSMAATNQAFLGRYDLLDGSTRLQSQQGIVAFATCRVTKQQVCTQ